MMRKIRLGKTELQVSELGFGGIPITRLDLKDAVRLARYCFEQGINFFDTANIYGDSELKLGTALQKVRERVILATKTFLRDGAGAAGHIEESLARLRTEYIDIYQLHNLSNDEALEEVMAPGGAFEALDRARDEGKIGHIGFSAHNIDIARKACLTGKFATVQIPFNYIEHDPAEKLFQTAREQDMGIIAMKPLGGGLLPRPDLCFRFLQSYEDVIPIAGVQAQREIDEILQYYREPQALVEKDWDEIEKIRDEIGTTFCHRCEYCQPCPEGVEIWRILLFKAQSKRFPPQMAIRLSEDAMKVAENCLKCGECEEKCPYELPVPELIEESLDYFRTFCKQYG
ncbi:aldo/keto reductase [Thermodesulfobacteriota bacterium]